MRVSGGAGTAKIEGDYANVAEQSGIVAGSGGYHVAVEGGVDLKAGVIASSSGSGITLSPSGIPLPSVSQPAKEEDKGVAKATLTPGNLTLINQTQDLASLNTDLSKANSQVNPFDIDRLKARQQSAAALSELLNIGVGDLSEKLGFAEGSPVKIALHAAVGAAVSAMAGGNIGQGALAGALSEIANAALQEVLKADPNLTEEQKSAITQWIAVAVGAAAGGQGGAAAALDNVNHNFLTHKQRKELEQELIACNAAADPAACKADVSQRYYELSFAQDRKLDACRTRECVTKLLGDLNGDPRFAYIDVLKLQELGVSEAVAQRLLSYQVMERWLTGDASVFEQRVMDVAAGVAYCEASGNAAGCYVKGQAIKYSSEAVMAIAYTLLGVRDLNKKDTIGDGQSENGANASEANSPKFPTIRDKYEYHNAIVNDLKVSLIKQGYRISEKEISFGSSCGVGRCRPDIVYQTSDGKMGIIEVKTGEAGPSIRQTEIFPQIKDGNSIPRGRVAAQFGLRPGIPLKEQGYPNGIPIKIETFPGVKQ